MAFCTITSSYVFHLLKEKKNFFFSVLFNNVPKVLYLFELLFLPPLLRGFDFFVVRFFVLVFFGHAASRSMPGAQ